MTSPLAGVALFRELPEPGLQTLAERGRPRRFATGNVIMRQGDASDVLHVITRGRVRVERGQAGETPLVLAELGAGDVIGEMGLLDHAPRSATVTALEDTETIEIHATVIALVVMEYPQVASALLRILSRRLRSADELADALARRPPR
ncbi:MAG TPA: cyclic nucleotide-binding domain-containing protein [Candidatus Limnocylindria bacterium]|nr:cyclic nucleotide-binding domain-containing protein [Candidatus Limnocylindria bacterium]